MSKHVVLLDMDGTITPARKSVNLEMCDALNTLAEHTKIGIVSGSSFEFIIEQCGVNFAAHGLNDKITILPCNGTQKYEFFDGEWQRTHNVSMKEELGIKSFNNIITAILSSQAAFVHTINGINSKIPISGSFVTFRGSMINWSIIGRDVTQEERDTFAAFNGNDELRQRLVDSFKALLRDADYEKIIAVLGGQTSIDISPVGWDKQYVLMHYPKEKAWFIGDRCQPGQNDHLLYKKLKRKRRAFETSGPEETIKIINKIIKRIS